jgi:hypothetical protein
MVGFVHCRSPQLWPITSASQFGPRPLLVEPDIAIAIDQSRLTHSGLAARKDGAAQQRVVDSRNLWNISERIASSGSIATVTLRASGAA